MDPITVSAAASSILALVEWEKVFQSLANETAGKGVKGLLGRLKPNQSKIAIKNAVALFTEQFLSELEDKTPVTAAIPGYRDQLQRLLNHAATDIAAWLQPETRDVDLAPVERMWTGLGLDPLPEGFDWALVAKNYARDIRKHVKNDPELREMLNTALLEQQAGQQQQATELLQRLAGPGRGFDLTGFREYLSKKCALLQLSAMHTSVYDRRIQLWSVFVPQQARESAPARRLPRDLARRLRDEGHLKAELDDSDLDLLRQNYQSSPVTPILEILGRNRLVAVLGDPGSGKTSLLKYLVMRWITQESPDPQSDPLPIWIDLKQYALEKHGFLDYCESGCTAFGLDANQLDKLLQAGEAALYLDGLDEVFHGPTRGSVVEEIAAFAARYPRASVFVTSRIIGYEPDRLTNAGFVHATLEDFDDNQTADFLAKWHTAAEDEPAERSRLTSRLQRALLESRAIRELAGNPLLLTMMAILNRNQELPRDRAELYAQASRVLLHEWDASRSLPVDTFGRQEKEQLLRELAGVMQQSNDGLAGNLIERSQLIALFRTFLANLGLPDPYTKANSLVEQLTERNFILCFAGADRFSFVHRTFLEYFCAAWFVELFQKKQTLTLDELKHNVFGLHWKDETWHEVLRLIAGMIDEEKAAELILFLVEQDGRDHKLANLMLAAGCLSEVRNRKVIQKAADHLWEMLVRNAIRYHPPYYCEIYEVESEVSPTRTSAVQLIASVWASEKSRVWLTSAAQEDTDWIVRRAAVQELARGWKDHPDTLPLLQDRARSDEHYAVRVAAVQEWARGWKDHPDTLPILQDRARSDQDNAVRRAALQELARGWKDHPDTLPFLQDRARSDENDVVRWVAVQTWARGWKEHPDTLPFLQDRARSDENDAVRWVVVQELAQGWKERPDTLPFLQDRARSDQDDYVRGIAVQELARGWKDHPETLPILHDRARSDESFAVRRAAVQELARGWKDHPDTLPILQDRARSDQDNDVRMAAVQQLARGWKDHPDILPILQDRARSDEHYAVRMTAVQELARGWKDHPDTLPLLQDRARFDQSSAVRRAAVQELARGWKHHPDTLPILQDRARSDQHDEVRTVAVRALARGWKDHPETLPILQDRARSDKDKYVRIAAVSELARGWKDHPDTLPILQERARSDEDGDVRIAAASELARGWKDHPDIAEMLGT